MIPFPPESLDLLGLVVRYLGLTLIIIALAFAARN